MKILVTSDVHADFSFLQRFLNAQCDLHVIAGDVFDGFAEGGLEPQAEQLKALLEKTTTPILFCTGNHDGAYERFEAFKANPWVEGLHRFPNITTDGQSSHVKNEFVVSAIPYSNGSPLEDFEAESAWENAQGYRDCFPKLKWLVAHHEPPETAAVGAPGASPTLEETILKYRPDFVICGHIHHAPYGRLNSFVDRIGKTILLNPGRGKTPNTIEITPETILWTDAENQISIRIKDIPKSPKFFWKDPHKNAPLLRHRNFLPRAHPKA